MSINVFRQRDNLSCKQLPMHGVLSVTLVDYPYQVCTPMRYFLGFGRQSKETVVYRNVRERREGVSSVPISIHYHLYVLEYPILPITTKMGSL
jgi:hypothetical protein